MNGIEKLFKALSGEHLIVERDRPLAEFTTYKVGGPAAIAVTPQTVDELATVARTIREFAPVEVVVVGKGSNLLVSDRGVSGVAILIGSNLAEIHFEGTHVTAQAGASLPVIARKSVAAGLTGFEWAVGVPGSIGGAVRMNAGGHGSDISESFVDAQIVDLHEGTCQTWTAETCRFGYRSSAIEAHHVVASATFALSAGDVVAGEAALSEIVTWRREHQPGGHNAGSVFANPAGDSAGRLIEASGLKGHRNGGAMISDKHANFIQTDATATANDVVGLMELAQQQVFDTFGVKLHLENRLVGFSADQQQRLGVV